MRKLASLLQAGCDSNRWTIVVQAKAAEGQPQSKTFGVSRPLQLAVSQYH